MLRSEIGAHKVVGYFHAPYYSMRDPRNAGIRFINVLKNDFGEMSAMVPAGEESLKRVLTEDFARIVQMHGRLTVVGIPRSKREASYPAAKMGLKRGIRAVAQQNPMLVDGLDYIVRHTDTCTTHWAKYGKGGAGKLPYPGITKDTCRLSPEIAGKDILLVDDIYTPTCGIDEDAIQALFDMGAKSVVFYAVGYTVGRTGGYRLCA